MATFYSGCRGRVRVQGSPDIILEGVKKWGMREQTGEIEVTNFESPVTGTFVNGEYIPGCIVEREVTISGITDWAASVGTPYALLINGVYSLDLYTDKTSTAGIQATGFLKSRSFDKELKAGDSFELTFRISGSIVYGNIPA